ncbi:hypothetical protein [Sphaerisporangium fuscum]|uniref:hypothetical protein n=1 Tax=Sphaerisporangium fuscum TaxID=2835868 RepID=UPI001BDD3D90|nr:hypothetical protein [Sphaerisporangium fuscum]
MLSSAIDRRGPLQAGAVTGLPAPAVVSTATTAQAAAHEPRRPLLAGANPYVTLYDGDTPFGYASMWRVDWSTHGAGTVLVVWTPAGLRVVGDDPRLAAWIEEHFVRNFDEARALPSWPAARVERAAVRLRVDPAEGAFARTAGLAVSISGPLDARPFALADFPLQGVSHGLSMQIIPCEHATITVDGRPVPGKPTVTRPGGRPVSSAVTTVHEAWSM